LSNKSNEEHLKEYDLTALITYEENRAIFIYEPYGWESIGFVPEFHSCCVFIPIGSELENYNLEGNILYLNLFDEKYSINESIKNEIDKINNFYSGKKKQYQLKIDDFYFRKTYLYEKDRYDITLIKPFDIGNAVIHGILKPNDLNWSINVMKKMLRKAYMMENKIKK
jgi:hypothetical protein